MKLFEGELSYSELLQLDINTLQVIVDARLENLKNSQELYEEEGKINQYTKGDMHIAFNKLAKFMLGTTDSLNASIQKIKNNKK